MMRYAYPFLLLTIAAVAGTCHSGAKNRRVSPVYRSDELASIPLRRIVLVPLEDEARAGLARAAVQAAVAQEFEKATAVEVIVIDPMSHMEVAMQDPPRRTGEYQLDAIVKLASRHGADGVLFGAITAYRPYAPQRLGIRLDLVSAQSGLVLWSVFSDFDLADDDAKNTLEKSFNRLASSTPQSLSWDQAQSSPARFAALVSSEAVATLKKK